MRYCKRVLSEPAVNTTNFSNSTQQLFWNFLYMATTFVKSTRVSPVKKTPVHIHSYCESMETSVIGKYCTRKFQEHATLQAYLYHTSWHMLGEHRKLGRVWSCSRLTMQENTSAHFFGSVLSKEQLTMKRCLASDVATFVAKIKL